MYTHNMTFVLKISFWKKIMASMVSQTPNIDTRWLIKNFYWLKLLFENSSLVNLQSHFSVFWDPIYLFLTIASILTVLSSVSLFLCLYMFLGSIGSLGGGGEKGPCQWHGHQESSKRKSADSFIQQCWEPYIPYS